MKYKITKTEGRPPDIIVKFMVVTNVGYFITTLGQQLIFRFFIWNIIKKGKEKYFYLPNNPLDKQEVDTLYYELREFTTSQAEIASKRLVIQVIDSFNPIYKFLKTLKK